MKKDAGTNMTIQSQDDELRVAKLKAKIQELLHSHDKIVREYNQLKNELEVLGLKQNKNIPRPFWFRV